jgi:hypothetical protein
MKLRDMISYVETSVQRVQWTGSSLPDENSKADYRFVNGHLTKCV